MVDTGSGVEAQGGIRVCIVWTLKHNRLLDLRVLDPLPLTFAQLISTRHAPSSTKLKPGAKSICGYRLARSVF